MAQKDVDYRRPVSCTEDRQCFLDTPQMEGKVSKLDISRTNQIGGGVTTESNQLISFDPDEVKRLLEENRDAFNQFGGAKLRSSSLAAKRKAAKPTALESQPDGLFDLNLPESPTKRKRQAAKIKPACSGKLKRCAKPPKKLQTAKQRACKICRKPKAPAKKYCICPKPKKTTLQKTAKKKTKVQKKKTAPRK